MIEDEEGARLVGIDPRRMLRIILALSGFLAALVAVTQSMVRPITVSAGFSITVFALIVTVLGGLGRSPGPCCGDHPRDHQQHRRAVHRDIPVADHPSRRSSGDHPHPTVRAARSEGMTEQYTEATGTSVIGGTERRASRSLAALLCR